MRYILDGTDRYPFLSHEPHEIPYKILLNLHSFRTFPSGMHLSLCPRAIRHQYIYLFYLPMNLPFSV
ncbi:hypothetical protein GYMLUDRAFT_692927 [Collybiopsis luxurians FD-317 M1]|uniref:Uncharacterized protein n=1 Tax=Collybiopsis luxurians FD-317 M1 TaxID=944289 RepID=A0A0D0CSG0_9AGAR|nr:hypothetical protein GYMLUDRAFT_692927 [Collybiopsis luxurians FD-317 M1]